MSNKPDLEAAAAACMAMPQRTITPLTLDDLTVKQHPGVTVRVAKKPQVALTAVDGLALYRSEFPEPVFAVDDLLTNGVTLLAARPKAGKSWLGLRISVAKAMGATLFGQFAAKCGRVLYCGLEESARRTNRRLRRLVREEQVYLQNLNFVYQLPRLFEGGLEVLDGYLAANHCELVVIDTLLAVVRPGQRDVLRSDYQEVNALRRLAEKHETAILVICHTRKAEAQNPLDAVAGTSGLTAACDAVWVLQKRPNGSSILNITGRDMEDKVLEMRFDASEPFGWKLVAEGGRVGLTPERSEILDLLEHDPLAPQGIAKALKKKGTTTRRLIQKLAADGLVVKDSDGRYRRAGE